ncbi:oxygen-independent coproporphyrinogen III oxidase [Teredinibacter sp. KSP-S5-2]|uniref:oxygen-independent coproporphyrinogen III oxidase n=1 Tax=Teredinibacter sp. KSP-S5-2 TaxID=3034506 RepID=UPI002934BDA8|nr:oxygen-independent coproporphyrinogen III oxidase [Teredinibacter sp. KSP-S5-2]WNO11063.1 oxygen-independent coproporphyrinogen III oxidase [Teredinibacter sp. KSP-S5-2]
MTIHSNTLQNLWNAELIKKYNLSGPRYTSYPTAPQFSEDFDENKWLEAVSRSNKTKQPLSLYFHIPFCDTVCYYCGCNKIVTANKERATPYLKALHKEMMLQADYIDTRRVVEQLHWGGGTPTYINDQQMARLMEVTRDIFTLADDEQGEYSIEIHPHGVTPERVAYLRNLGFNRISMGVQDFDPTVQKAVNRFNSESEVRDLADAIRANNFKSFSLDLIYGLPHQTKDSFLATLDKVIHISPDRLSVFNYAHMPHLFKTQKQIDAQYLPEPQEKLKILHATIERLLEAGYVYIGMDHFAKPDDELTLAQQHGSLNRNFQGYATRAECDLFAFGVSSISFFGDTYCQNQKNIDNYYTAIADNRLPLTKGIQLTQDDLIRRYIINQLICNFELNFKKVETHFNIQFAEYFQSELTALKSLEEDGLLILDKNGIRVELSGRLLIRHICMTFDAYIDNTTTTSQPKYSRIL